MTTKLQEISQKIDYAQNLKRFLNVEDLDLKILKRGFGLLKGVLKKTPTGVQREMRREWERKFNTA